MLIRNQIICITYYFQCQQVEYDMKLKKKKKDEGLTISRENWQKLRNFDNTTKINDKYQEKRKLMDSLINE